ncbi:Membrane protein involved in the export of O-antigen and teichoic acid [Pedobacter westerhofensis]|uniref:Membrane protein involved in the export of O-antigen and teichoic acid n=1 Tax=Pedobacter westerhofensis TaxID=425512 RepID=A0A521C7Y4_9SPHI|nr:polysaccharide biosynthesis protein [Pedobacter westerhofensis]SMO54820.1 Membrane protein involved in the export of O-antigen and teichoic acid [Pedobacter westerhofensis]
MKSLLYKLHANPKYARAFEWGKLVSVTGSAQMLVQGIALISGIFIIRLLPTDEYALYTLANTMLGTISLLADGGISTGTLATGGKVWQDPVALGKVVVTGMEMRKKFAIASLAISLPILFYLLISHGATWMSSTLIAVSLIPAFYAALSDNLLEIPLKLNQDITPLQKNQVAANIARILMLVASLFFLPFTFIAILANGLPRIWANIKLRKVGERFADYSQGSDPEVKREILKMVKRTMPSAIYFCVSSQITIWLISIYGNTASIAKIGALGRLAVVLTIFTTLFSTLVVPRFARLSDDPKVLLSRFIQIVLLLFGMSALICGFVYLFPSQVLYILGKNYGDLHEEILLITISGCIGMVGGITYSLSVARGWILPPAVHISVSILAQALLIYFMDLSDTTNVLMFSIINVGIGLIMSSFYFFYRVLKHNS